MWKEKIKHYMEKKEREREREKKKYTEGRNKRRLIFLLYIGDKQEISKFIFNAIHCLMEHNNLSC